MCPLNSGDQLVDLPLVERFVKGKPVRLVRAVDEFQVVKVVRLAGTSPVPGAIPPLRLDETAVQNVAVAVIPPVEGVGAAVKAVLLDLYLVKQAERKNLRERHQLKDDGNRDENRRQIPRQKHHHRHDNHQQGENRGDHHEPGFRLAGDDDLAVEVVLPAAGSCGFDALDHVVDRVVVLAGHEESQPLSPDRFKVAVGRLACVRLSAGAEPHVADLGVAVEPPVTGRGLEIKAVLIHIHLEKQRAVYRQQEGNRHQGR